jgi:hypothetical protein
MATGALILNEAANLTKHLPFYNMMTSALILNLLLLNIALILKFYMFKSVLLYICAV